MITDLIPQRAPILMVDDAVLNATQGADTTLLVTSDNWFASDGILLEAGLVEHMAQSAAAMVGLYAQGEEPKVGYIGDIKDFTVERLPRVGETVHSTIQTIAQLDSITLIEAVSRVDGEIVAQSRIKVFIVEE